MADLERMERDIAIIKQAVVGIPESPDENGLIGDCREMKEQLRQLNGEVKKNTTARRVGTWLVGIMGSGFIALIVGLLTGTVAIQF